MFNLIKEFYPTHTGHALVRNNDMDSDFGHDLIACGSAMGHVDVVMGAKLPPQRFHYIGFVINDQ